MSEYTEGDIYLLIYLYCDCKSGMTIVYSTVSTRHATTVASTIQNMMYVSF